MINLGNRSETGLFNQFQSASEIKTKTIYIGNKMYECVYVSNHFTRIARKGIYPVDSLFCCQRFQLKFPLRLSMGFR